jgi:hypothetical protein
MSPSTDRQTFRETVAAVAEAAKAKLPQAVNGRVESAAKLVLWQDVEPQADGTILVGSASDPGKTYHLVGTTCECQDFIRGQAPEGWCQHRIAAGIARRVQQLLAALPTPVVPDVVEPFPDNDPEGSETAPAPLPEAPASANVHVTIAGRDVLVTLRDTDETRLLARLTAVLERYPLPTPVQSGPHQLGQDKSFCALHNMPMKEHTNAKGRWFSHYIDGKHCKGR